MKTAGVIDVGVTNRTDGVPILKLEAKDEGGRKFLTRLEEALRVAQLIAVPVGKADIYNVCGGQTVSNPKNRSESETVSLTIALALGGIGLRLNPNLRGARKK